MLIKKLFSLDKEEKIFQNFVPNGGMTSILMNVCVIGDSLSSGETELIQKDGTHTYFDKFEYSWGQFLARDSGIKVTNLSHGGQTAYGVLKEDREGAGYFTEKYKANAYIIALGVNDLIYCNQQIGELSDIDDDTKLTYAHDYGNVVRKMKELSPNARFFFVTMPKESQDSEKINEIKQNQSLFLHKLSKAVPNSYVLDLYNDLPIYDEDFRKLYFLNGHMNAAGYRLTAQIIESGIDFIIRHNMDDFREFGLMGYPEYDENLK